MRERWFGASGRTVPEIAVEGELELDDALVLDGVSDTAALKEAHDAGRPVVVRACSADGGQGGARPPGGGLRASFQRNTASCSTST